MSRGLSNLGRLCALGVTLTCLFPCAQATDTAAEADAILDGAEQRFQPPSDDWFDEAQQALREEAERVSQALEKESKACANAWKQCLRWELLERNLGPAPTVKLNELEVVRRWMYSNRPGLESPFFAALRTRMDDYLDAAYTIMLPDLQRTFVNNVALARAQSALLIQHPSDANAAALGRTLGWFERTRQLAVEIEALKSLVSRPNCQILLSNRLIRRVMATEVTDVMETVSVSEQVNIPRTSLFQRRRVMRVGGTARTRGVVQLLPLPNDKVAELALVFDGTVDSTAWGRTGPVSLRLETDGTARAVKSFYISPEGLTVGKTNVTPNVRSRVTGASANSDLARTVALRRASEPQSRSLMNQSTRSTTVKHLRASFDARVDDAIAKLRSDAARIQSSLRDYQDVAAPLAREGAVPYFAAAESSASGILLSAYARQRGQLGAAAACPNHSIDAELVVRVHVSTFNNMAETITGGKTLSDEFFMKYAKVLHAELPLPLMVHSRAPRWAFTMAKHRPIELRTAGLNQLTFIVRIDAVDFDGATSATPARAEISYLLERDDLGDYSLQRMGAVQLETAARPDIRDFVLQKVDAFFGPTLNGGGVVIPAGGLLGAVSGVQLRGIQAEHEWIVAGWDVPSETINALMRFYDEKAAP